MYLGSVCEAHVLSSNIPGEGEERNDVNSEIKELRSTLN